MIFKSVLNEIESIINLGKLARWVVDRKVKSNCDLVSTRLVQLLGAHGVHRNQIPRLLGHELINRVRVFDFLMMAMSQLKLEQM